MRIGIDARTILNPEKGDAIGVGHYTYQLIRHLLKIDRENEYVLFFDFRVREKDVKKFTQPNVKVKFYPFSDYKKYLPVAYSEILGTATLVREKLDLLHSTSPQSRIPMGYSGKCVVTFHDLAAFETPDCLPRVQVAKDKALFKLMASKADHVIAASASTREGLKKHLDVPEAKTTVIYSGIDTRFFDAPENSAKVLGKFNIEKKYILFLGTLEPSKNIVRLIEAFGEFKGRIKKERHSFDYQLVLAGKRGWLSQEYHQLIKDLDLAKDVIFTGYVVGEELVPLFKGAEFFVMPSLYEGFGMTVLEAFATGTPAIISNVSSLPEIAGDAAYYVNPFDTHAIANGLYEFATDENLRGQFASRGIAQVSQFTWEKTAQETLAVYRRLLQR